ncbi:hypothetical protein CsSME_00034058 [Camellia sinensis var. sinensis]
MNSSSKSAKGGRGGTLSLDGLNQASLGCFLIANNVPDGIGSSHGTTSPKMRERTAAKPSKHQLLISPELLLKL